MPQLIIAATSAVIVLPFLLLLRESPGSTFPHTPWSALAMLCLRSALLSTVAALFAAAAALAIVVTGYLCLPRPARRALFAACAIPFLFPPVVTAHAVNVAFGRPLLVVSMTLVALPYAVFGQAVALRFVDATVLATARDLGLKARTLFRLTLAPVWFRGAVAGWLWGALVLFSDPGIYEVYGGTRSYFASHLLRAVNGGAPPHVVARAVVFVIIPALILASIAAFTPRWLSWPKRLLNQRTHPSELMVGLPCARRVKAICALPAFVVACVLAIILVTVCRGTLRAFANQQVPDAAVLVPTIVLILVTVPLSAGGALGLSIAISHTRRWFRAYGRGLVAFMVIASPVAVGAVLAGAFRMPVSVDERIILPSLVGGGAVLGGWVGLLLAAVSVCMPLSTVLLLAALSLRSTEDVAAARDLGASRVRVLLTVEAPYMASIVVSSLCLQTGMLLTTIAPIVFVQPGGTQLVTPTLLILTASSLSDEAFALAFIAGLLTCCAMVGITAVVRAILSSSEQRRRWRKL